MYKYKEKEKMNPWNIPEYTKLKHIFGGWKATYVYDLCYKDWFLNNDWNGSLISLDGYSLEEFEIIS